MKKIMLMLMLVFMVATATLTANGQGESDEPGVWPQEDTLTIIVPAKPGGVNDTIARIMQKYLQSDFDATIVVSNYDTKAVAYQALYNAKPDGYTIMLQHTSFFCEAAGGTVAYDPTEEMTVLGKVNVLGSSAYITSVDAPYDTFTEMIEYAKAHPGEVTAAYSAKGLSHFQIGSIELSKGIDLKLVSASSESEKLTNVAGGFIDIAGVTLKAAKEYADAGKVKIISVANGAEYAAEKGYEQMEDLGLAVLSSLYMYMWGPKDMDQTLVQEINDVFCELTETAGYKAELEKIGFPAITTDLETSVADAKIEMKAAYELADELGL